MPRTHQTADGRLLTCEASQKPCPYGKTSHFSADATKRIKDNRPGNDRELNAWFNMRTANDKREATGGKKRRGMGYKGDFIQAVLWAERIGDTKTVNLLHDLRAKHGNPRMGGSRAVFDRGDGHVIKIAIVPIAHSANNREARMSANPDRSIPIANCWIEDYNGTSVLIAEKIRELDPSKMLSMDLPAWADDVDSYQVGYNRAGELVAYDL